MDFPKGYEVLGAATTEGMTFEVAVKAATTRDDRPYAKVGLRRDGTVWFGAGFFEANGTFAASVRVDRPGGVMKLRAEAPDGMVRGPGMSLAFFPATGRGDDWTGEADRAGTRRNERCEEGARRGSGSAQQARRTTNGPARHAPDTSITLEEIFAAQRFRTKDDVTRVRRGLTLLLHESTGGDGALEGLLALMNPRLDDEMRRFVPRNGLEE